MKQPLALLALGLLLLMVQGAVGLVVPVRFLPDLGLVLVVAIALSLRSPVVGVTLAALLGFATDVFSSSLLGQHALVRMALYGIARFGAVHLNLRGPLPQAVVIGGLCFAQALGIAALSSFFAAGSVSAVVTLRALLPQALVTGVLGPLLAAGVAALAARLADDESGQRPVRLEPRAFSR